MKVKLSSLAIITVLSACFIMDFSLKHWEKPSRVIDIDVHWYYGYLPAQFIYDDIELKKSNYQFDDNYSLFWTVTTPEGKKIIKSTMGLAFLYAPFFFVAHSYALLSDYPANGFSEPYKIFLLLSSIFYLFVGLDFVRKILLRYGFEDRTIAITLLLLGLGTNLFAYSSQSAPMPHVYNFCLFSIFIYYTLLWHERQSAKNTLVLGLLFGLITLIRPSNAVIIIFFFLYGVANFTDLKQRMLLFKKECFLLNVIFLLMLLVWIPQLLYWKKLTGDYLVYSYPDEMFFFLKPKILEGLFSFRKGWLLYTPMMAFALIGIFLPHENFKKTRWAVLLFCIVNIYIIFSWWCWWYGGSYGQRPLIDSYGLMAIPLAFFVKYISEQNLLLKIPVYCAFVFFIWLNIFQTYQFEFSSLHYNAMSKTLYFKQFGKLGFVENFEKYLEHPNEEEAKKGNNVPFVYKEAIKNTEYRVHNTFTGKTEQSRKVILLQSKNGKYVCAELDHKLYANKDAGSGWETFTLVLFDKAECAILAYNNNFLCDELNNKAEITATRKYVGHWETFTLIELGNSMVSFKSLANGKYLSVDQKSLQLFANEDKIEERGKFKITVK